MNTLPLTFICGPCTAESLEILEECASFLTTLQKKLDHPIDLVFKASFDKANRSSSKSFRGHGLEKTNEWFKIVKEKYQTKILTDIHLPDQVAKLTQVDVLQIPAFLCRQTDLLVEAIKTGKVVNVKKGQFVSPENAVNIIEKFSHFKNESSSKSSLWMTERGYSFGYHDLMVDMPGFKSLHHPDAKVIFDVTHACQSTSPGKTTSGNRWKAPLLARAALSTGYVEGFFIEVHPNPKKALSDQGTQLNFEQARLLIEQLTQLHALSQKLELKNIDSKFI